MKDMIEYLDFEKVDISVGTIIEAKENIDNSALSENEKNVKNVLEKYAYKGDEIKNDSTINFKNEDNRNVLIS